MKKHDDIRDLKKNIKLNDSAKANSESNRHEKMRTYVKAAVLVLFIVGIPLYLWIFHGDFIASIKSLDDIKALLDSHRSTAGLIYVGLQVMQVVICFLPGEVFQMAAGYFFDFPAALALAITGMVTGSILCFFMARFLGKDFIRLFIGEEKLTSYIEKMNSPMAYRLTALLFLIPGIPKDLLNYAAGASEMEFGHFILISSLARVPGIIGSILMGNMAEAKNYIGFFIVLGVAVIAIICGYIYKKRKKI